MAPTSTGYIVEDNSGHQEDIDRDHVLADEMVRVSNLFRCVTLCVTL